MTWIKICGITNLDDARTAVEAGADALGFVFYEKSPRRVDAEHTREIIAKLPDQVEKVGVFVNTPMQQTFEIAGLAGLSAVQLYRDADQLLREWRELPKNNSAPKMIPVIDGNGFADAGGVHLTFYSRLVSQDFAENLFALLVDCTSGDQPGGTGQRFDWTKARGAVQAMNAIRPTIVAGGLDASNVQTAMTLLHPWGVDVSSGVEAKPSKKDPEKIHAFIKAVREADKASSN